MAALLTTISTRSNCWRNAAKASATLSGSLTSAGWPAPAGPGREEREQTGFRLVLAGVVDDRHVAAGAGQLQRDGAADAAGGSRDKRNLSGKWFTHKFVRRTICAVAVPKSILSGKKHSAGAT